MLKCPICNSKRVTKSKKGIKCKKCGYINKKWEIKIITNQ